MRYFTRGMGALTLIAPLFAISADQVDGITFAGSDPSPWVPIREVGRNLGMKVLWDAASNRVMVEGTIVEADSVKWTVDNTTLIRVHELEQFGAQVRIDPETKTTVLAFSDNEIWIRVAEKRVVINLDTQRLQAFQGDRLVLDTKVSTGRGGHRTPTGEFDAGPLKQRMHYSTLYNNSPMPWSVQVEGHIFIHGYHSVPDYPASHGCIRVPLTGRNPARWFFDWVELGTPISVVRD